MNPVIAILQFILTVSIHVHFYSFINQGVLFYWYKEINVSL